MNALITLNRLKWASALVLTFFYGNVFSSSLYVTPTITSTNAGSGTIASPFTSLSAALDSANVHNIDSVYIVAGEYLLDDIVDISTNSELPIVVTPAPGATVRLTLTDRVGFEVTHDARNIIFKDLNVYGASNAVPHYTILANYFWEPDTFINRGGGIAFQINGQDITIEGCIIHDFYQKAVNIEDARYLTIKNNVIYNIATTSLSGGHAIMRQQGTGNLSGDDDTSKYRWDINGNLIYNAAQRIYSWVPSKGYLNMTLDEGKPINIDETSDKVMKARITNNVIAFFSIDAIRIKTTPNLEVSYNSIYTSEIEPDGISDMAGETYTNIMVKNNVVQVAATRFPFLLTNSIKSAANYSSNYGHGIKNKPTGVATLKSGALFVDPENGDFTLNPTAAIPANNGANLTNFANLKLKLQGIGQTFASDGWNNNHKKNAQTTMDNVPGVWDDVVGNENVFTNKGVYGASNKEPGRMAMYFSMNPAWKAANSVAATTYEIVLPAEYSAWLDTYKASYPSYDYIHYGESYVDRDFVFGSTNLAVDEIHSATDYNKMECTHAVTLGGDLLINFTNGYTPTVGDSFTLITADTIKSNFALVSLSNYSGDTYLQVEEGNKLVLHIGEAPVITDTKSSKESNVQVMVVDGKQLRVSGLQGQGAVVSVLNQLGQIVQPAKSLNNNVLVTNLTHGIYLVKIVCEGKVITRKVIVR